MLRVVPLYIDSFEPTSPVVCYTIPFFFFSFFTDTSKNVIIYSKFNLGVLKFSYF